MKQIFFDKTTREKDIIENELDKWNIHYRTTEKIDSIFGLITVYDIEVDIEPAFFDYIQEQVLERKCTLNNLENSYRLTEVIEQRKKEKEENKLHAVIDRIEKQKVEKKKEKSIIKRIQKFFNTTSDKELKRVKYSQLPIDIKLELKQQVRDTNELIYFKLGDDYVVIGFN